MSERIFIGVAWPYANGPLHMGHIAGAYLAADIFARYQRVKGNEVLMVSGSDQHGTPITITAEQEGVSPAEIFHAVRHIAAHEGHVPNVFRKTTETVLEDGWLLKDAYSDFVDDDRDDLGLNPDFCMNDTFVKLLREKYFKEEDEE